MTTSSCRISCGIPTLSAIALAHLLAWLTPIPATGEGILVLSHTRTEKVHGNGTSTITGNMRAEYVGPLGGDLGRQAVVGTGLKESNAPDFAFNNLGSRIIPITTSGQIFACNGPSGCAQLTIDVCVSAFLPTKYDQRSTAAIERGAFGNYYTPTPLWTFQIASTGCTPPLPPPPPPPFCNCSHDVDCEVLGDPGLGTWVCHFCRCIVTNSPLVLHLPDYLSTGAGRQSWWREGVCTSEAPIVCLDWSGDGNVACTGWPAPESEIAFVVSLSHDDILLLSEGLQVPAEPWRHFFGNVTKGPEGDFPFAHGFEALAAHCGHDPGTASEIAFTECGLSLHVWSDHDGDGDIAPDELLELQDLGIESLGQLRTTGKKDACGNTFPVESHATCADRPGRCGTWLDLFFVPR